MRIKTAIVEDDSEIAALTISILNLYADIYCTGVFKNAEDFIASLATEQPEVVLMDIGLPAQDGIACVAQVHAQFPDIEFIMFTNHNDSEKVFEALKVGATGYVLKGGTPENLANAIREVKAGGSPMTRSISRLVAHSFQETTPRYPELEQLTRQECDILRGLDMGWSYKEIAANKFISEHTVRSHIRNIYEKLQVHSRTDAVNKWHGRS